MSIRRTDLNRGVTLALLMIFFYLLRTIRSRPSVPAEGAGENEAPALSARSVPAEGAGENEAPALSASTESDRPTREASWEPYKIAIAAFYAICVQRAFETSIQKFSAGAPQIQFDSGSFKAHIEPDQIVLVYQLLAVLTWMGLYYINNIRLYFLIPVGQSIRRALAHIVLTAALAQFYFLAATIGTPTVNQLLLISGILLADAVFPMIIGPVLSPRLRIVWVMRGIIQTSFIVWVLVFVPPAHYTRIRWSASMLLLMLVQLFIIAPLESRARRRIATSPL